MLTIGLLWFDDDLKRPLGAKLDEAMERYAERFGAQPTLAHLHPTQAEGLAYARLRIVGDAQLRRNHFLLGSEEAEPAAVLPAADLAAVTLLPATAVDAPALAAALEASPPRRRRASSGRKATPTLGDVQRQSGSRRAS
jgi:hypothetical protein